MPRIESSTELRNNYNSISAFCRENREPVFITKNGRGDLAVMSIELYEEIAANRNMTPEESRQELYRLLDEGHAATLEGHTRPFDEFMKDLKRGMADGSIYN